MAEKGWTTQTGAAAGIAAGAGAAQLGLGYGLGVIEWPVTAAADSTWLNSLGWATWITASATVLGAVIAGRLHAAPTRLRTLWRLALSAAAGLGALVAVALVALPARTATRPAGLFSHSTQLVAVGYALIGLAVGMVVAFWAVSSAPVAANLLGTAAWLWALAVTGVAAELTTGRDLATYLTSWQFVESQTTHYAGIYWPSALLTLTAAFLIGLLAAYPTARHGNRALGTATSGALGPLLVALAFLALSPLLTKAAGPLQSAYLIAPYAVLSGLAGSALITTALAARRSPGPDTATVPEALPAEAAPSVQPTTRVVPQRGAPVQAGAAVPPEPGSPAKPAEPAKPTKSAEPAKPTKPVEPAAPAAPPSADPEIAAAAGPVRPPAKRPAARKDAPQRSTITPPPAAPPIARINPKD